jgi:hypothetical protein
MKRATTFMVEKVSTNGGYVWAYLPDMSRRWGEIEAKPSMAWVQPPGTATMGHLFLDAYHATGDEYYYQAAEKVAGALIWGQHRSGGWNYFIDFDGPASTRHWYETVGRTRGGWRNSSIIRTMPLSTTPAPPKRCSSCCASTSRSTIRNTGRRSSARSASCWRASIRSAAGRSAGPTTRAIPTTRNTSRSTTTSRRRTSSS